MAILGSLIVVGGCGLGTVGLLQCHQLITLPPELSWLSAFIGTIGDTPEFWVITVCSAVVGIALICVSAQCIQKRNTDVIHSELNQPFALPNEKLQPNHSFPEEILEVIFGHLTSKSLNSAALVCRNWRHLTDQPVFWAHKLHRDYEVYNKFFNRDEFVTQWLQQGNSAKQAYLSMSTKRFSSLLRTVDFKHDSNLFSNGPQIVSLKLLKDRQGVTYLLSLGENGTFKFWNLKTNQLEWERNYSNDILHNCFGESSKFHRELFFLSLGEANDKGIFIDHKEKGHVLFIDWDHRGMHHCPTSLTFNPSSTKLVNPYTEPDNLLQHFEIEQTYENMHSLFTLCNKEKEIAKVFQIPRPSFCSAMIGNTLIVGCTDGSVHFCDYRTQTSFYEFNNNGFYYNGYESVTTLTYNDGVLACGGGKGTVNALILKPYPFE